MAGKIFVVGIGPGGLSQMTPKAREVIEEASSIVGYTLYVDLVKDIIVGKRVLTSEMKKEVVRAKMALDEALEGRSVAFVCSGDAGVYGMAGIMMEVAKDHPEIEIEVVSGITAACSGAALLGAPLIHDFAVISLSDLLTPWEKIEKRLRLAVEADFVLCIYNPKSKKRIDYIDIAARIAGEKRGLDAPAGYVKHIGREKEEAVVCTIKDLINNDDIDMFTTVFIGNSQTQIINGRMVTPRGYKYE